MSFYADYIREKTTDSILETEKGFATYRFIEPDIVYLADIYVTPDFRRGHVAAEMADEIASLAKVRGCKTMIGSVVPSCKNSTDNLRVLLGYGMRLKSSGVDFIVFEKEL